jgi:hypothetical protein
MQAKTDQEEGRQAEHTLCQFLVSGFCAESLKIGGTVTVEHRGMGYHWASRKLQAHVDNKHTSLGRLATCCGTVTAHCHMLCWPHAVFADTMKQVVCREHTHTHH